MPTSIQLGTYEGSEDFLSPLCPLVPCPEKLSSFGLTKYGTLFPDSGSPLGSEAPLLSNQFRSKDKGKRVINLAMGHHIVLIYEDIFWPFAFLLAK